MDGIIYQQVKKKENASEHLPSYSSVLLSL